MACFVAMGAPKRWEVLSSERLHDCAVFAVSRTLTRSPNTGNAHPFYRIEADGWVNVVPITPDEQVVMVRQYRHGADAVTLEIPGGIIDPGEDPATAAGRELREETGYRAARLESLGCLNPNPALFANRVHMQVALECEWEGAIDNGETEETAVELLPLERLHTVVREGGIDHALVVAALYNFDLWRGARGRPT